MKKLIILTLALPAFLVCKSQERFGRVMADSYVSHTKTEISLKIGDGHTEQYTIINGERIAGTPFLYEGWLSGVIVLKEGRVYDSYKLKYDAYNQAVYFFDGNNPLEVSDAIKEFTLASGGKEMHFVNLSEYKKTQAPLYLEVLMDDQKGQLLKSSQKVIVTNDKTLADISSLKYLAEQDGYLYYNKKTKQISAVNATGNNIESILGLSESQSVNLDQYDFSKESDLVSFFTKYFKS